MDSFYGEVLRAGSELKPTIDPGSVLRVTQVALPSDAKGRVTVYAVVDGKTLAIGTLDPQAALYHLSIDLIFSGLQSVAFTAKGTGSVHICGYTQPTGDDAFDGGEAPQDGSSDENSASDEFAGDDDFSMDDGGGELVDGDGDGLEEPGGPTALGSAAEAAEIAARPPVKKQRTSGGGGAAARRR